ncbi:hypothetical protein [Novosphingobium soli]|uniref:Uncharacterized protein n=1 Tax=Novosphingobium soli TaxID=574956 RepID=A0ABV6CZJ7_9SPHN
MDTEQALTIIDRTAEKAFEVRGANDQVRAALKHLSAIGIERDTLEWFWKSLFGTNEIGRDQNANASRNRIRHLAKEMGRRA